MLSRVKVLGFGQVPLLFACGELCTELALRSAVFLFCKSSAVCLVWYSLPFYLFLFFSC